VDELTVARPPLESADVVCTTRGREQRSCDLRSKQTSTVASDDASTINPKFMVELGRFLHEFRFSRYPRCHHGGRKCYSSSAKF
jgi:hypothetical protein